MDIIFFDHLEIVTVDSGGEEHIDQAMVGSVQTALDDAIARGREFLRFEFYFTAMGPYTGSENFGTEPLNHKLGFQALTEVQAKAIDRNWIEKSLADSQVECDEYVKRKFGRVPIADLDPQ